MNTAWIIEEKPSTSSQVMAHTEAPRFVCRIAEPDDRFSRLSKCRYVLKGGYVLCDFDWIDGAPDERTLRQLLESAGRAWEINWLMNDSALEHGGYTLSHAA